MIILFITKLLIAFIGIVCLSLGMFYILRLFDKLLDINFKEAFNKIEANPVAMSIYYGLRMLGVTISLGLVICFCLIL